MPSPVGGIDSIRSNQMTITNYQNEYKRKYRNEYKRKYRNEYQNEYLTLSTLGDGVAPADTFIKIAPMTLWSIGAWGLPSGWEVVDYEVSKFARPA